MFTQFYNQSIRKLVIGFGSLFNDIRVARKNVDGQILHMFKSHFLDWVLI